MSPPSPPRPPLPRSRSPPSSSSAPSRAAGSTPPTSSRAPGEAPREAALEFARGLACTGIRGHPPLRRGCRGCRISTSEGEPIEIDLDGRASTAPLYRHIGDHPDLFWVERERGQDTRVHHRVRVRAAAEGAAPQRQRGRLAGRRHRRRRGCSTRIEAQNGTAEAPGRAAPEHLPDPGEREPGRAAATIRSRCQRVVFPVSTRADPARRGAAGRASRPGHALRRLDPPHRPGRSCSTGPRSIAATGPWRPRRSRPCSRSDPSGCGSRSRREVEAEAERRRVRARLDAFKALARCRRDLVQRNANPQMVAERALFAVRESFPSATAVPAAR